MSSPSKNKSNQPRQETQLQQSISQSTKSYPLNEETTQSIEKVPLTETTKNSSFSFWCIVIFFGIIFGIICGFVLYQENHRPLPPPFRDHQQQPQQEEQEIYDQPYKEGDEIVETYDLIKQTSPSALCLDGSPGSYYLSRTGDPSRILIFFEAGGWCMGGDQQNTLKDCLSRSHSWFGSSTQLPLTAQQSRKLLSKHPDNYFRNWKKVHFNYCDGSGHQGSRKDPVEVNGQRIYFRGHNITTSHFEDLEKRFGFFSKAKKVVVSGWSAGGLSVFTWANYVKERVRHGKVYAIPDAGIFYDSENIRTKAHSYKNGLQNLMKYSNAEIDPPVPQCIRQFPYDKVKCMFAQNLYKHIKTPMFVVQSLYDSWSLPSILGIYCLDMESCSDEEKTRIQENRKNITQILQEIGKNKRNGVFGIGCALHGMLNFDSKYMNPNYTIPSNSSFSLNKALEQWFKQPKSNNIFLDHEPWPSNQGCA